MSHILFLITLDEVSKSWSETELRKNEKLQGEDEDEQHKQYL